MDRVYPLLQGLKPEFEGIQSLIFRRKSSLRFDDVVSQLINEESRLQEQNGTSEGSIFAITDQKDTRSTQNGQVVLTIDEAKKGQPRNRDNQWCNYCKRKRHTKEKCWKLNRRPPQDMSGKFSRAYLISQPYYIKGGTSDGHSWDSQHVPPSFNSQPPLLPPPTQPLSLPLPASMNQDLQQQVQNLMAASSGSSGSIIGSTSLAN